MGAQVAPESGGFGAYSSPPTGTSPPHLLARLLLGLLPPLLHRAARVLPWLHRVAAASSLSLACFSCWASRANLRAFSIQ